MERAIHTTVDIERMLVWFESEYGISSEEFYDLHLAGDDPENMPGIHRHVWASMYRDALRLGSGNGDFAARAERVLALA